MKFKRIFQGSFIMGSDQKKEDPAFHSHRVTISRDFFIGIHEVTQAQYERVMGGNPSELLDEEAPVDTVTWHAAKEFCNRLSAIEKRSYRLPTEAEWEFACRAGTNRAVFWLETEHPAHYAWGLADSNHQSQPVGRLKPNPWGLYDMIGNVKEWCEDFFGPYDDGGKTDPKGPTTGEFKVIRGGSYQSTLDVYRGEDRISYSTDCYPHSRSYASSDFWTSDLGFRVVLDILPTDQK